MCPTPICTMLKFYKHVPEEEYSAMVEDDLQKVLTFSVTQLFGRMKSIHPSVIRSMTAYSLSRILPLLGGCILSKGMYIG